MHKTILQSHGLSTTITQIPAPINQLYLGDTFVLKIYKSVEEWQNSVLMYELFEQNSLVAPNIIAKGKTPKPYLITTIVKGVHLTSKSSKEVYRSFARWVATLHTIKAKKFGGVSSTGVGKYYAINKGPYSQWKPLHIELINLRMRHFKGTLFEELIPQIKEFFESIDYPNFTPSLTHEDLNSQNIFVKDERIVGVIDPDHGYFGCYEEELMRIEEGHFVGLEKMRKVFLDEYQKIYPLLPGYEDRRSVFRISRNLVGADYYLRINKAKKDLVPIYNTLKKLLKE